MECHRGHSTFFGTAVLEVTDIKEKADGTYYNPFVVPEKVYEKDGNLYMEVGQGADGDYYGHAISAALLPVASFSALMLTAKMR